MPVAGNETLRGMNAHQPRMVPRGGLDNPVFDGVGGAEELIVSLSFLPGLTNEQTHRVHQWIRALETAPDLVDPARSPFAAAEPFVHENLFHIRIGNLHDPRRRIRSFVDGLMADGVWIRDSFYACWEWRPDGVMGPRRDPRAPAVATEVATVRDFLDRLWDPTADPPASEIDEDLKGGFMVMDELILEHRGAPLFLPGIRIGYGIVPFDRVPLDKRTEVVRRDLVDALANGWNTLFKAPGKQDLRPQPLNSEGAVDQIEKIRCGTRTGYMFSVETVQLLDRPSPYSCRFREYELMEAVLDTVQNTGLAPVVTWQRYGTPTMMDPIKRPDLLDVQLWEVGGDHTGQPGLDCGWPVAHG
jgi:hypothetical protein